MIRNKRKILVIFIGLAVIGLAVVGICWRFIPTTITEEKAIRISKSIITASDKETITNYDNPQIEVVVYKKSTVTNFDAPKIEVVAFGKEIRRIKKYTDKLMVNRKIYMITYTTYLDPLAGPIVIYVDAKNGIVYGGDIRA